MGKAATATSTVKAGKSAKPSAGKTNGVRPSGSGGGMAFKKVDFNVKEIPPDAPEGGWTAKCKVKKSTDKNGYARLILEWKLLKAFDEEHETFEGGVVSDLITFVPDENVRQSKMTKLRLRDLSELLEFDLDIVPTSISSWGDLKDLIEAIDGAEADIYTYIRKTEDGDRTNVRYKEPGGGGPKLSADDDDDEDEDDEEEEDEDEEDEEESGEGDEEDADDEDEDEEEEETPAPKGKTAKGKK